MRPWPLFLLFLFSSCVPVPVDQMEVVEGTRQYPDPTPVAHVATAHFVVRATSEKAAGEAAAIAEAAYDRVMAHTGLWSFKPRGLYPLVVYGSSEEFLRKTGMPGWSAGLSIGRAIYTHEGPQRRDTIVHEVSHLVVYEYLGGSGARWLNEGLAVYEEIQASPPGERTRRLEELGDAREDPIPFDRMVSFEPSSEQGRLISRWYLQSASVVGFLIERGGRRGVSMFLERVKAGRGLDSALAESFPTLCGDLASLERAWQAR